MLHSAMKFETSIVLKPTLMLLGNLLTADKGEFALLLTENEQFDKFLKF
jgi:hypothetical protein